MCVCFLTINKKQNKTKSIFVHDRPTSVKPVKLVFERGSKGGYNICLIGGDAPQQFIVSPERSSERDYVITDSVRSM